MYFQHPTRTMARLLATVANPTDRTDYHAALVERANRIIARVWPRPSAAHGFYDPQGFVASCRANADRNQLRLAIYARLAQKALMRGHPAPELAA